MARRKIDLDLRAKEMRLNPTRAESVFASKLKGIGVHFIQQKVVRPYIVDFYIPDKKLAIEVDGDVHETMKERDARRDEMIRSLGIRVIRISNLAAFKMTYIRLRDLVGISYKEEISKIRPAKSIKIKVPKAESKRTKIYGDGEDFLVSMFE